MEAGWRDSTRTVVMQQLFDEINVCEDHTPAAVPFKLQFVESVTKRKRLSQEGGGIKKKCERGCRDWGNGPFAHVFCE